VPCPRAPEAHACAGVRPRFSSFSALLRSSLRAPPAAARRPLEVGRRDALGVLVLAYWHGPPSVLDAAQSPTVCRLSATLLVCAGEPGPCTCGTLYFDYSVVAEREGRELSPGLIACSMLVHAEQFTCTAHQASATVAPRHAR
jgi:hypothetical protein